MDNKLAHFLNNKNYKRRKSVKNSKDDEEKDTNTAPPLIYKKRAKSHWKDQDTRHFYECLALVGTDFTLMANLFDQFDKAQLKRKYQREIKQNKAAIDKIVSNSRFSKEAYDKLIEDYRNRNSCEIPTEKPLIILEEKENTDSDTFLEPFSSDKENVEQNK